MNEQSPSTAPSDPTPATIRQVDPPRPDPVQLADVVRSARLALSRYAWLA
jgi:hypothetical protein